MAFHFSLAAMLQLRITQEQLEERALLDLRWKERRSQAILAQMAKVRREQRSRRVPSLSGGVLTGADLRFSDFLSTRLEWQEQQIQHQLAEEQERVRRQHAVFLEARRRRETVEALRDRELRTYREEEERREQRSLDDLFLLQLLVSRGSHRKG